MHKTACSFYWSHKGSVSFAGYSGNKKLISTLKRLHVYILHAMFFKRFKNLKETFVNKADEKGFYENDDDMIN